jgi:hypothetical protein
MPIVPPPPFGGSSSNNSADTVFIDKVRRILRDQPVVFSESQPTDNTTGSLAAGSKPFRLQRAPVWTGLNRIFNLTAPGGPYTIDFDDVGLVPGAGHVNINTDTGEVIFPAAPAVGTLAITYQAVRYSNQQITDALYEGLSLLWPEIWNPQVDTTTVAVSPTQFEYALPTPAFQDQRTVLLQVEYAPPSGIVRYFKTSLWRMVYDTVAPKLIFQKLPPVASTVRLTYTQPLGDDTLGAVPILAQHLPVYYGLSRLLMDQETMRGRADDLPALTGESANPTGSALSTSSYWIAQFYEQLTKLSLNEPARYSVQSRAVERLGLSDFWTNTA